MFQPVLPATGLVGWRFLQSTYESQFRAFTESPALARDSDYFRERIGSITRAEDLVADRRLLGVALGAFGLEADIDNRYFIRRILEEGTVAEDALATRFADSRYRELAQAFGFGPQEFLKVGSAAFVETIVARFEAARFEVAVGDQSEALRVGLYAQRELPLLAAEDQSLDTKWFTIMGDPPLRQLFERALNLPTEVGQIDIDQQLTIFKDRARALFGSDDPALFAEAPARDRLLTRFMVGEQLANGGGAMSGRAIALSLLGG